MHVTWKPVLSAEVLLSSFLASLPEEHQPCPPVTTCETCALRVIIVARLCSSSSAILPAQEA